MRLTSSSALRGIGRQQRRRLLDQCDVLLHHRPLGAAHLRVTERIERRAAQALHPAQASPAPAPTTRRSAACGRGPSSAASAGRGSRSSWRRRRTGRQPSTCRPSSRRATSYSSLYAMTWCSWRATVVANSPSPPAACSALMGLHHDVGVASRVPLVLVGDEVAGAPLDELTNRDVVDAFHDVRLELVGDAGAGGLLDLGWDRPPSAGPTGTRRGWPRPPCR